MKHEEKINYMRIAAGICGYGFTNEQLDLLVSIYDLVLEKQEKSNLKDVCQIEEEVKKRADVKAKKKLLDNVSDKVG